MSWQSIFQDKKVLIIGLIVFLIVTFFFLPNRSNAPDTSTTTPEEAPVSEEETQDDTATSSDELLAAATEETSPADEVIPQQVQEATLPPTTDPVEEPATTPVSGVSASDQTILLREHNTVRQQVGVPSLTWSPTVAASAQNWADELAGEGCSIRHSKTQYGENLYYEWMTGANPTFNPSSAVGWWAAEEADYSYENNSCSPGAECSHYTQLVWDDTTQIGCGKSQCAAPDRTTVVWVCQYSPAGNVDGDRPY